MKSGIEEVSLEDMEKGEKKRGLTAIKDLVLIVSLLRGTSTLVFLGVLVERNKLELPTAARRASRLEVLVRKKVHLVVFERFNNEFEVLGDFTVGVLLRQGGDDVLEVQGVPKLSLTRRD
jgi:hypothetical protein